MKSIEKETEVASLCDAKLNSIDGDIEASYNLFEKEVLSFLEKD